MDTLLPRRTLLAMTAAAILFGATAGFAEEQPEKIRALILDGQNNHNWRATTPVIRSILQQSGRFTVDVATMPTGDAESRSAFSPNFDDYDVVVSNYSDFGSTPAPTPFLEKLLAWVAGGGNFVAVHAATAGMGHHPAYYRLVGLTWGTRNHGERLAIDSSGNLVRTPKGEGRGTGHGLPGPVDVTIHGEDHPITQGLPRGWQVPRDELWFAVRGPAENLTILATGYSPQTQKHEPILWTVDYGRGRVFVTLLGHDTKCMDSPGFRVTLCRGAEWAATGAVTQPVPEGFPKEESR